MTPSPKSSVSNPKGTGDQITHDEISQMVGDLEDAKVAAIMAIGPTVEELEEAIAWAEAESDVMGKLEKPLNAVASQVYEILMTRKEFGEDER